MRVSPLCKPFLICLFVLLPPVSFAADDARKETKRVSAADTMRAAGALLPAQLGDFRAAGSVAPYARQMNIVAPLDQFGTTSAASRVYRAPDGRSITVRLKQAGSETSAYSLLTTGAATLRELHDAAQVTSLPALGTAAFAAPGFISFYKGPVFVQIEYTRDTDQVQPATLARLLADSLAQGTSEMPALMTHLPGPEAVRERAAYIVNLSALRDIVRNQPVLDAVSFDGGTEAAAAKYDQGQLVIVEFQTPQLASDTDARVVQRIAELRSAGQAVPAAYRREGNYSVFVFDAPSEQAANELIGQVKYEKVVQWLGEDPHRNERANRFWINMSSSLIVNTVKATGLAILLCLSVGGLFGGVIFMRRRAQATLSEKYSDAGGMMRLNLDELATEQTPVARLLPPREE